MPPISKSSALGVLLPCSRKPLTYTPLESSSPEATKQGKQPIPRLEGDRWAEDTVLCWAWLSGKAEVTS